MISYEKRMRKSQLYRPHEHIAVLLHRSCECQLGPRSQLVYEANISLKHPQFRSSKKYSKFRKFEKIEKNQEKNTILSGPTKYQNVQNEHNL